MAAMTKDKKVASSLKAIMTEGERRGKNASVLALSVDYERAFIREAASDVLVDVA